MIASSTPSRTAAPVRRKKAVAVYLLTPALLVLAGGVLFLGADPETPNSAAAPTHAKPAVLAATPPAPEPVIAARSTTPLAVAAGEPAPPVIPAHPGDDSAYMTPEEERKLYGETPSAGTP